MLRLFTKVLKKRQLALPEGLHGDQNVTTAKKHRFQHDICLILTLLLIHA